MATVFTGSPSTDLVVIGGYVHSRTGVSLGPYANQMLADLNAHLAILSTAGINERGCYNSNLLLVEVERAMMAAADQVIVVADCTKFGRQSLARLCELKDVDAFVVDSGITEDWRSRIIAAGSKLMIAGPCDNAE